MDKLSTLVDSFQSASQAEMTAGYLADFFDGLIIPAWIKVLERGRLRMHRVNRAYELETGVAREFYQGKVDEEIWTLQEAIDFAKNDQEVMKTGIPIEIIEVSEVRGQSVRWRVRKWPLRNFRGRVVGVCGTASRVREA